MDKRQPPTCQPTPPMCHRGNHGEKWTRSDQGSYRDEDTDPPRSPFQLIFTTALGVPPRTFPSLTFYYLRLIRYAFVVCRSWCTLFKIVGPVKQKGEKRLDSWRRSYR